MNVVLSAINDRRVCRHFNSLAVAESDLRAIAHAGWHASHAGNRRILTFLVLRAPERLDLLRTVSPGILAEPTAAIVIVLDSYRVEAEAMRVSDDPSVWIDVGTTAMTMMLAAESLGLGSCPTTSFSQAGAARALDLPDGAQPQLILQLGHRAPVQDAHGSGSGSASRPQLREFLYWENYRNIGMGGR